MSNAKAIALYVAISVVAFVTSKIILSILLYKKWKRKHLLVEDYSGTELQKFPKPDIDSFLKLISYFPSLGLHTISTSLGVHMY